MYVYYFDMCLEIFSKCNKLWFITVLEMEVLIAHFQASYISILIGEFLIGSDLIWTLVSVEHFIIPPGRSMEVIIIIG